MLPIFHPTTTILVDDVLSYLESVVAAAPPEAPILPFDSPAKAIAHIQQKNREAKEAFNSFLNVSADTDRVVIHNRPVQEQIVRLNIGGLPAKVNQPSRFDEVSVIICDYAMPFMKGTDFFEKLGDIPQKRILLTGEADSTIAVQAFNDGIIDQFITKGQPGAIQRLFGLVRRYQRDYFSHQYASLMTAYWSTDSLFVMPQFDKLVQQLRDQHGFLEHYYVNFPDGALLFDEGQKRKRLVALRDEDYDSMLELLAERPDVDPEFICQLAARAVVPNESYGLGPSGDFTYWKEMCRPALKFEHPAGDLYFALFDLRDEIDLDQARFFGDYELRRLI